MSLRPPVPEHFSPHPENGGSVSQRARALESLIASSLAALRRGEHYPPPAEALLFIGNWNDALPRLLIYDQILEPVDKIVWAVIRTRADPQRGTAFPSYATVGRLANVGSEATVSRALAILRVTRWLTHCGRARDGHGRFRGNVYLLHDEPLALADTLYLDQSYMAFAYQAAAHRHARVALVASGVLRSLELDVAENSDAPPSPDPLQQRLAAQQASLVAGQDPADGSPIHAPPEPPSVYGVRARLLHQFRQQQAVQADQLQILKTVEAGGQHQFLSLGRHLQNLKAVHPQNLEPQISGAAVVVGSSSKSTTTTTQVTPNPVALASPVDSVGVVRWPPQLTPNHRHLAAIQLRGLPIDLRQTVLDILDQRLRAVERGAERLHYGPLAYLKTLCVKAAAGQLVLPQTAAGTAIKPAALAEDEAKGRLKARLRVARADHTHWQRVLGLESRTDQQGMIQQLVDQATQEVARIESELASLIDTPASPQGEPASGRP